MWEYEHVLETTAAPEAIWRLWSEVAGWGAWNAEIEHVELNGPFAAGSEILMTPPGQEPIRLRIAEAVENESFVDEAEFDGLVLRTAHRIAAGRLSYRMEISGPAADQVGPEIGPQITADWPETMAALVTLAEG